MKTNIPRMPKVKPRRPLYDYRPYGYKEGFRDFAENNAQAVEWFLEHHAEIRRAVNNHDALVAALEFYAADENWRQTDSGIGSFTGLAIDYGFAAKEALKKIETK